MSQWNAGHTWVIVFLVLFFCNSLIIARDKRSEWQLFGVFGAIASAVFFVITLVKAFGWE